MAGYREMRDQKCRDMASVGTSKMNRRESGLDMDDPSDSDWNYERELYEKEQSGKSDRGRGVAGKIKGDGG